MGVSVVWDVLKPGFEERLPFVILVTQFYKSYGRPIKIAIDAYQWIFECRGSLIAELASQRAQITRLLTNFHYRIRYLLSLNISFVFVFDGAYKPWFKNKENQSELSAHLEHQDFDEHRKKVMNEIRKGSHASQDEPDIRELKNELRRWNIDFVETPSEGEAEAADLQKLGIVDYVLSNDTDTMIYGATKILRNFSKFKEDKPASAIGPKTTNEYWVTPIIMDNITQKLGFDKKRLLLLSILCGADYNTGVGKLGPQRSCQIALSSTTFIKSHGATVPYDSFPDFATELNNIYSNDKLKTAERIIRYKKLQKDIFDQISKNLVEYFGRNEVALVKDGKLEGYPPDYIVKLYYKPLLCTKKFTFKLNSTNLAEIDEGQKWLTLPDFDKSFFVFQKFPPSNVVNIGKWFSVGLSQAYLLKCVIYDIEKPIKLEKTKIKKIDDWEVELVSVRFQTYFKYGNFESESENKLDRDLLRKRRTPKGKLEWIPLDLIPLESGYYQEFYIREEEKKNTQEEKKRSPKKIKPKQSSNLISMGFIDVPDLAPVQKSPLKQKRSTSISKNIPSQKTSVLDLLRSPSKESPTKLSPISSAENSPHGINLSPLETKNGFSPLKSNRESPHKLEFAHTIDAANKQSPIKVKSRKQALDSSLSKDMRTSDCSQLLKQEDDVSLIRKRLIFSNENKKDEVFDSADPFKTSPSKTGISVLDDLLKGISDSESDSECDILIKPVKPKAGVSMVTDLFNYNTKIEATSFEEPSLEKSKTEVKLSGLRFKASDHIPETTNFTSVDHDEIILIDSCSESEHSLGTLKVAQEDELILSNPLKPIVSTFKSLKSKKKEQLDSLSIDVNDSSTPAINKVKNVDIPALTTRKCSSLKTSTLNSVTIRNSEASKAAIKLTDKPHESQPGRKPPKNLVHKSFLKLVDLSDDYEVHESGEYAFETDYDSTFESEMSIDGDVFYDARDMESRSVPSQSTKSDKDPNPIVGIPEPQATSALLQETPVNTVLFLDLTKEE